MPAKGAGRNVAAMVGIPNCRPSDRGRPERTLRFCKITNKYFSGSVHPSAQIFRPCSGGAQIFRRRRKKNWRLWLTFTLFGTLPTPRCHRAPVGASRPGFHLTGFHHTHTRRRAGARWGRIWLVSRLSKYLSILASHVIRLYMFLGARALEENFGVRVSSQIFQGAFTQEIRYFSEVQNIC